MSSYKFAAIDMTTHSYTLEQVCDLHAAEQGYLYVKGEPQPDWMGDDIDWSDMFSFMQFAYQQKFDIELDKCNIYVFDEKAQATFWRMKHLATDVQARHFKSSKKSLPQLAEMISLFAYEMLESYEVSVNLQTASTQIDSRINEWVSNGIDVPDYWIWERETLTQMIKPYLEEEQDLFKQFFKLKFSKW
jgi:hypothetical protein